MVQCVIDHFLCFDVRGGVAMARFLHNVCFMRFRCLCNNGQCEQEG
jgi:hypothetical protein